MPAFQILWFRFMMNSYIKKSGRVQIIMREEGDHKEKVTEEN